MYEAVNDALNEVLLGGRFESRPLYLVLDKRAQAELAELLTPIGGDDAGNPADACCSAAKTRLERVGDPYSHVLQDMFAWRANGRKAPPPYTAVLFTLSHAAEMMVADDQFSSNNYYQRLASITGVDAGRLSQHGKSTELLWRSFNNWLADTDFQFGRPTARAGNSFKYVGIAMSQAIVREEDRQRFHDLFEKYGFRDTDDVTTEDIAQYIDNWVHSGKPTGRLKAAWQKAELRQRVCEAAVAELQEWSEENGRALDAGAVGTTRLSLAASFRHDLAGRAVTPWLGREAEAEVAAISGPGAVGILTLANARFGNFATLEPRSAIDWVKALSHGIRLASPGGSVLEWKGRAVIPMRRSDKGQYWVEVSRASLGVEHFIFCRADPKVKNAVEAALGQVAGPGYTLSTNRELAGLPAGWIAYENVLIIRALDDPNDLQLALSPLGESSGLQVLGGLKMGQSIWHQAMPPVIELDARHGKIVLSAWPGASADGEPARREESESGKAELAIAECPNEGGNVHVQGEVAGKPVGSITLLLRSASRPRPLDRKSRGVVAYTGVLSSAAIPANQSVVRGLLVSQLDDVDIDFDLTRFRRIGATGGEFEGSGTLGATIASVDSPAISIVGMSPELVMRLPCPVRGLHVFKYETLPVDFPRYAPVNKQCRDCGVHVLERRDRPAKRVAAGPRRPPVTPTPTTPLVSSPELDLDLWFDAACFWGTGTSATFEALVSASGIDAWRVAVVLRDLSWLGHLDLEQRGGSRVRSWSVAPPVLAFKPGDKAYLAGFRSQAFLDRVGEALLGAGGVVSIVMSPGQPRLIEVEGLSPGGAGEALRHFRDYHGREIVVVEDAAFRLARFCLARGGLGDAFSPATLGQDATLERFDVARARWRSADTSMTPGAYRSSIAGMKYFLRGQSGQAYAATHELVKLAAARQQGVRLHAYDAETRTFSSVLGCEPPGLLGRALVACSGALPAVSDGMSSFAGVPANVASIVLDLLYDGELPS